MTSTSPYHVLETKRLLVSTTEFWDNGIIFIKIDNNVELNLTEAQSQHDFLKLKFDGINKHIILVEPGNYSSLSKEAREFSTDPKNNAMTLATAVVVKSLAQRLVINFMISITSQATMKMKMFDTKEKAIIWLLKLKK